MIILIHHLIKIVLIIIGVYFYLSCFSKFDLFFGIFMVLLFSYIISQPAGLITNFLFYIFSKPVLLKGDEKVISDGIPKDVKIAFFRPIFAKTFEEMNTLLENMKKDIINNQEPHKNLKFIVIDNTRDPEVKEKTKEAIKKLQQEFGDDVVFYFHRNVKCDFFKKAGILFDALIFLYEGKTRPSIYIDKKWEKVAKGTRDPNLPLWDIILGDIRALGIKSKKQHSTSLKELLQDILSGEDVEVDKNERIKFCFVSDADNYYPKGEVRKIVAKMVHPENKNIVIFQPTIEISNPKENKFIYMEYLAREYIRFDPITKWRMYRFSPFYGKGAMNVANYIEEVIKSEWLNPEKAASHDFQEALKGWCVLLEDCYILEKTFSNKVSQLKRFAQWQWGDLETVTQFIFNTSKRKWKGEGRRSHLFTLLRILISNTIFNLWFLLTILSFVFPHLLTYNSNRFLMFLGTIVGLNILIPNFLMPIVNSYKDKKYPIRISHPSAEFNLIRSLRQTILGFLIHNLDLVYQPIAFLKNYVRQIQGKPFVWITGAMGEIETRGMSIMRVYKSLWLSVFIGLIFLTLILCGIFPKICSIIIFPFVLSFLFGPLAIWYTSKVE